jgi:hypothetical protein
VDEAGDRALQKRDALMRDLRDTTLRLAVRALLAALAAA